jgi:hypothetical protein
VVQCAAEIQMTDVGRERLLTSILSSVEEERKEELK